MLGIVWNNGTLGHKGTAPHSRQRRVALGGTTGETGTSADERQRESVSAVAASLRAGGITSNKNPLPLGRGVCQKKHFRASVHPNPESGSYSGRVLAPECMTYLCRNLTRCPHQNRFLQRPAHLQFPARNPVI